MRFAKLRISAAATSRLRAMRQRTTLTPNLLCRVAVMLSLEQGPLGGDPPPDEEGQEFNAYTLTGEWNGMIGALLRFVEERDGATLTDGELLDRFRGHIHRGVATLSVRAKGPGDIARLAAA
jgi:DNA sulfur modification protein DndE